MRATKAYIASLGTTGLLLAFSASLLLVVSALFAFNAWPGADIRDAVESLVVDDEEEPFRVAGPIQVAADAAPAALAVATAADAGGSGELPLGDGFDVTAGEAAADDSGAGLDESDSGTGGDDGPIDGDDPGGGGGGGGVGTGALEGVADEAERTTRGLGETVGAVNEGAGQAVSDTGQALSEIVRDLPDVTVDTRDGALSIGD